MAFRENDATRPIFGVRRPEKFWDNCFFTIFLSMFLLWALTGRDFFFQFFSCMKRKKTVFGGKIVGQFGRPNTSAAKGSFWPTWPLPTTLRGMAVHFHEGLIFSRVSHTTLTHDIYICIMYVCMYMYFYYIHMCQLMRQLQLLAFGLDWPISR